MKTSDSKKHEFSDTSEQELDSQSLNLIRGALAEAQVTVRAYDTKAQIVGVGYAFALGIVANTETWFPKAGDNTLLAVLVFWCIVMTPLILFGYVLYPSRKTAPAIDAGTSLTLEKVLYVDPSKHDLEGLKTAVNRTNLVDEYAYETLRVSALRDLKRVRFIRALTTAAFSFSILFAAQIWALSL